MYVCMYLYVHIYVCMYVYMYICICICMYICIYVYVCICMYIIYMYVLEPCKYAGLRSRWCPVTYDVIVTRPLSFSPPLYLSPWSLHEVYMKFTILRLVEKANHVWRAVFAVINLRQYLQLRHKALKLYPFIKSYIKIILA